jgi:hypothetical protein
LRVCAVKIPGAMKPPSSNMSDWWGISCRFVADEYVTKIGDRRVLSIARHFRGFMSLIFSKRHQTHQQRNLLDRGFHVSLSGISERQSLEPHHLFGCASLSRVSILKIFGATETPSVKRHAWWWWGGGVFYVGLSRTSVCQKLAIAASFWMCVTCASF